MSKEIILISTLTSGVKEYDKVSIKDKVWIEEVNNNPGVYTYRIMTQRKQRDGSYKDGVITTLTKKQFMEMFK